MQFKSSHGNICMLLCYASTNNAPDESKEALYERLPEGMSRVARHDAFVYGGDFNAILFNSKEGFEACMGRMVFGSRMRENGMRFGIFCLQKDFVIGELYLIILLYIR